ncbi:toxin Cry1Ac domain D-VI-related protein [Listeria booriae]|uniref:immunoglobulin-like domain-containing protein n=1 Tax=Listeria booriae TaxID=1552123 RepID=UPI0028808BCD|nr:immunoglobulin-like domain-containing protein [Listeria booriae]MDT0111350.1 toxin Cry1Ac domain D-VI-related protein [Listeria booriae]
MKKNMLRKVMNVMTATAIIGSGVVGSVIEPLSATQAQASVMPELGSKWDTYSFDAMGLRTFNGTNTITNSMVRFIQSNGASYGKIAINSTNNLEAGKEYEIFYSTKATTTVAKHSVDVRVLLGNLGGGTRLSSGSKFKMSSGALLMIDVGTNNAAGTRTNYNFDVEVSGLTIQKTKAQLEKDALEEANQNDKEAQDNAREAVNNLFENKDPQGLITADVTQDSIKNAKELVAAIKDADKKAELEAQLTEAQKQLDAKTSETVAEQARQEVATDAVKDLFNNNDTTGTIKDNTTQEAINTAKELVAAITDADKKAELEAQLTEAQKQLDAKTEDTAAEQARQEAAKKAVEELFNNNDTTGTIKDNTTQEAINNAKELVAAITDADKKAELEAQIAEAQKQVDAKTAENEAEQARQETAINAVEELFNNNDTTGTIKDNTTQEAIDNAKELVATITDADKKAELEKAITEAQKQLTEKETKVEVTGKGNTFTLQQDRYLTGTYTGDVASMSVDINGKRYYGGTVKNGEFNFYALDKIAKETDEVLVNLHGADKSIQTTFAVVVKSPTKITSDSYKLKDSNITGTFNNTDITKMNVVVNGKTYWGGTVANGEFKFYALDKITSATDEVTMNFFNANNELIISKNLTITAPVVTSGEITSATLAVGDKNIVGTITGDIKSFGVTIDGITYNGGTIAADGTFKFYVADKKFTADSNITIVAYDKSKNTLSEMNIVVSK